MLNSGKSSPARNHLPATNSSFQGALCHGAARGDSPCMGGVGTEPIGVWGTGIVAVS